MYEYFKLLDSKFWQVFFYGVLSLSFGCYFLSLSISGAHFDRLGPNGSVSRVRTSLMCGLQAIVCFLAFMILMLPMYSDIKVVLILLIYIIGGCARFFYWQNLSIVFKEHRILQLFYSVLIICSIIMALIHLILYFTENGGQCCLAPDVINNIGNYILRVQLPFNFSPLLKTFLQLYITISFFVYLRFFYLSIKNNERMISFGIAFTVLNFIYMLSYFDFGNRYYIPLYFIVDVIVYTRLQRIEVEQLRLDFKVNKSKNEMLLHDISNPLHSSWMRLRHLLRNRETASNQDIHQDVDELYKATTSAIGILKKYKEGEAPRRDISIVIDEVIGLFSDLKINYIRPDNEIEVNSILIKNILINLIENSYKALGSNFEWINIMAFNHDEGMHIRIVDNGKFSNIKKTESALKTSIIQDIQEQGGRIELGEYQSNTCFDIYL